MASIAEEKDLAAGRTNDLALDGVAGRRGQTGGLANLLAELVDVERNLAPSFDVGLQGLNRGRVVADRVAAGGAECGIVVGSLVGVGVDLFTDAQAGVAVGA